MTNFNNKKQQLRNILQQVRELLKKSQMTETKADTDRALASELDHLEKGELNVVVCGEAKRGKSSLINAFLGEAGICPVDAAIATNCATIIRYADNERILVSYTIEGEEVRDEISRAELAAFVTEAGNPGQKKKVNLVQIFLPNEKLKGGLVVIDTPGVGGLFRDHSAVTYQTIPYSDAVVFVGSAMEPLNKPETEFFVSRIAKHTDQIVYVSTHRDSVSNWDERLKEDLHTLALASGLNADAIPGVSVSNTNQMRYWQTREEHAKRRSGFEDLDRVLAHLLANKERILLGRMIGCILPVIQQLRLPLEAERTGLQSSSTDEIEAIEAELRVAIKRAGELDSNSAPWCNELRHKIRLLANESSEALQQLFLDLNLRLNEYVQVEAYVKDTAQLGAILSADCSNGFADVVRQIERTVGNLASALSEATSLTIDDRRIDIPAGAGLTVERQVGGAPGVSQRSGFLHNFAHVGRQTAMNIGAFGALGSLGGAMVGGIIGFFAGGVGAIPGSLLGAQLGGAISGFLGSIFGVRKGLSEVKEREIAAVRQAVLSQAVHLLNRTRTEMQKNLGNLLETVEFEIQKDLIRKIQADRESCRQAAAALESAKREKQGNYAAKLRELTNLLKRLEELERALNDILSEYSSWKADMAAAV